MSHVAKVDVEVKSLADLSAACKALGLEWCPNERSWRWYPYGWQNDYDEADAAYHDGIKPEEYGKADAGVVRVPGASYDIGVYCRGGKYLLVYDNWKNGRGIEAALGAGLPKLKQAVAEAATRRVLGRQGFHLQRQVTTDGRVVLTAMKGR